MAAEKRQGGSRGQPCKNVPLLSVRICSINVRAIASDSHVFFPKQRHILQGSNESSGRKPRPGLALGKWGALLFPDIDLLSPGRGLESKCLERGARE